MVAWKALLWPCLVLSSGFVWVFLSGLLHDFVPIVNSYILDSQVSTQTFNAVSWNLNVFTAAPGIVLILLGVGLIVDAVWHGGND